LSIHSNKLKQLQDKSVLQSQVDGLEITLEKISVVIADRRVSTYQQGELTPLNYSSLQMI